MAVYAIGDLQGCFDELQQLLEKIRFSSDKDQLWFVGDLVNRGPKSLEVVRFIRDLGENAVSVLGNHDLHLLGVACGAAKANKSDTLDAILSAPDREALLDWMRFRPLTHRDDALGYFMVHAGINPLWNLEQTETLAKEVQEVLRGENSGVFFQEMYSDIPICWNNSLQGWERLRSITDYLTRLRFCSSSGKYLLSAKSRPGTQPDGYAPWYEFLPLREAGHQRILFGHWAALGGAQSDRVFGLDTGCLWGGCLTALQLGAEPIWHHCDCPGYSEIGVANE